MRCLPARSTKRVGGQHAIWYVVSSMACLRHTLSWTMIAKKALIWTWRYFAGPLTMHSAYLQSEVSGHQPTYVSRRTTLQGSNATNTPSFSFAGQLRKAFGDQLAQCFIYLATATMNATNVSFQLPLPSCEVIVFKHQTIFSCMLQQSVWLLYTYICI